MQHRGAWCGLHCAGCSYRCSCVQVQREHRQQPDWDLDEHQALGDLERKDRESIPGLMSDAWLADCTLFGKPAAVLEGLEAWREAGVTTPILVPSSAVGKMPQAFEELFALF